MLPPAAQGRWEAANETQMHQIYRQIAAEAWRHYEVFNVEL